MRTYYILTAGGLFVGVQAANRFHAEKVAWLRYEL